MTPKQAKQNALLVSYREEKKFWDEVVDLKIQQASFMGKFQCDVEINPPKSKEDIQHLCDFAFYQYGDGFEISAQDGDFIDKITISFESAELN